MKQENSNQKGNDQDRKKSEKRSFSLPPTTSKPPMPPVNPPKNKESNCEK